MEVLSIKCSDFDNAEIVFVILFKLLLGNLRSGIKKNVITPALLYDSTGRVGMGDNVRDLLIIISLALLYDSTGRVGMGYNVRELLIDLALLYDSTGRVGLDYKLGDWLVLSNLNDPKKPNTFSKLKLISNVGFLCLRKISLEGNRKHIIALPNQFVLKIVPAVTKTVQMVILIQTTFKKELKKGGNIISEIWKETKRKW